MGKFKEAGDQFMHKNNGKVVTGEVLVDYGQFYLVMWHQTVGTFYLLLLLLPAELVDKTYEKVNLEGDKEDNINNNYSYSYFHNPTCPPPLPITLLKTIRNNNANTTYSYNDCTM
jgi:hypothetical protein